MILLRLFLNFFKTGLFAVGGGMATIPFLQEMGHTTGWFTDGDLTTMIAVSESTPGPIGVNMATYVGFQTAGLPGAVIATLGLITPSIIIIMIIAGFLQKFRQSKTVEAVFSGLRPASTAISAVEVLIRVGGETFHTFSIHFPSVLLAAGIFCAMRTKKLKSLHPIVFIALAAVLGIVFQF